MSKAAVSSLTWGIYLALLGLWMMLFPAAFCSFFGFTPPSDFWLRLAGGLIAIIGYLYLRAAQGNVRQYFQWTVEARPAVLLVTVAFVLLGYSPPILILFGVIDLVGVAWMFWALRSERIRA